ncbi:MAG: phytanoyl-CoA dioxygenase family protein [Bacteroidia bacterium]|jgi:ectoine hydroxylase-related dioxygenase (phytanoyl-CoA dioxygenase family)
MDFAITDLLDENTISMHTYSMQRIGYSIVPDFLSLNVTKLLREHLENVISNYQPVDGSTRSELDKYHMHDLICKNIIFGKTLEDRRLQQLIGAILGEYWIMYAYTSSSLPPNGANYGSRIHVDSPRFIPNYATNVGVIWALNDFTIENGSTHVLPGSHNSELEPSKEYFEKNSIRLTCKEGDLIIFNARLFHCAGINFTNKFRHALTLNACRPYMKQRMDWVRFVPESISKQLNAQARRILGFDTRIPTNLKEFFLPENQRFYKSNQE